MKRKVVLKQLVLVFSLLLLLFTLPNIALAEPTQTEQDRQFQVVVQGESRIRTPAEDDSAQLTEEQARFQGGIAAAISGLLAISFLLRKRLSLQQQLDSATQALKTYSLPPQSLAPGVAAHLCGSSSAALATLFDLAQRGFLRIEEREPKWGQRVFEIVRRPSSEALQLHEEAFLDALFRHPKIDRVPLSQVVKLSYSKSYQKALEDELMLRGWHSIERLDRRRQFAFLSGFMMALGLLGFALGVGVGWAHSLGAILMGSGGSLILSGLVGLILTLSLSTLTDQGAREAVQWEAFAGYLKEIAQSQQPLSSEVFERYLPFAAGFGLLDQWVNKFFSQSEFTLPDWFVSNPAAKPSQKEDAFAAMILAILAVEVPFASVSSAMGGSSETVLSSVR